MRNTLRSHADPAAYLRAALRTGRYRVLDWLGLVRPLKLRIGLTNRCNSKCIMCNVWKQQADGASGDESGELSVGEIDAILSRNSEFLSRLTHIALTGGEPTLRRDFADIWRILHKHHPGASISFNSNGFHTSRILEYVEAIVQFHPRTTVMISVDGFGEIHDRVRGVENIFPKVMATLEGVEALRAEHKCLRVEVNYVMTPVNARDCVKLFRFCRERRLSFNPIYCVQGELYFNEQQDNVSLTDEDRASYIEAFQEILMEDDSLQTREILDQLQNRPRDFNCWAGRITLLIEENGDVYPNGGCPSGFRMGSLRAFDYSLSCLLESEHAQNVLAEARKCRICRLSCETMTTLQYPEALCGYRKSREAVRVSEELRGGGADFRAVGG